MIIFFTESDDGLRSTKDNSGLYVPAPRHRCGAAERIVESELSNVGLRFHVVINMSKEKSEPNLR
jgi:hypothetical protein